MKLVNPLKTFACLAFVTLALSAASPRAMASEALQKGMLYDKAFEVTVACLRAAGAFTSVRKPAAPKPDDTGTSNTTGKIPGTTAPTPSSTPTPSPTPTPSLGPDIRPSDTLDAVGIKTEFHLDALRAYLMLNERIGVPSVYRYDDVLDDVRPFLIDGEALASISSKTTVATLAATISAEAGVPMLPFSTIESIIADCRYKIAKKTDEASSGTVVASDLGVPMVHPFMTCVADNEPKVNGDFPTSNNWNDAPGATGIETVSLRGPNGREITYRLDSDRQVEIESGLVCNTDLFLDCQNWTYRKLTMAIARQAVARIPSTLERTILAYKIVLAYLPQAKRGTIQTNFASFSRKEIEEWLRSARYDASYQCRVDTTSRVVCLTPPPGRNPSQSITGPERFLATAAAPRSVTPPRARPATPSKVEVMTIDGEKSVLIKNFTNIENLLQIADEALSALGGNKND